MTLCSSLQKHHILCGAKGTEHTPSYWPNYTLASSSYIVYEHITYTEGSSFYRVPKHDCSQVSITVYAACFRREFRLQFSPTVQATLCHSTVLHNLLHLLGMLASSENI